MDQAWEAACDDVCKNEGKEKIEEVKDGGQ